jgi:hypothetical protein
VSEVFNKVCWVVPILPGKTEIAREYVEALETTWRAKYEKSQEEIGIEIEVFFIWHAPDGSDYIVLYMSGPDLKRSFKAWEEHQGEFETFGKSQWPRFTDPAALPNPLWSEPGQAGLPELVSAYDKFDA